MPRSLAGEKIRVDIEKFLEETTLETYLNGAGLKDELEIAEIYTRYSHLFSTTVLDDLGSWKAMDEKEARQIAHLHSFLASEYLQNSVKELTDKIETMETKEIIHVDSDEMPFRLAAVKMINESDRARRTLLFNARNSSIEKMNELAFNRLEKLHEVSTELGYKDYVELSSRLNRIDLHSLARTMELFVANTDQLYSESLGSLVPKRIGINLAEAEKHDIGYLFRGKEYDQYFQRERLLQILDETLQDLGIPILDTIKRDVEERPKKSPRAFCAPVKIPSDIRLAVMPTGGLDDYESLFHENGHAQHFAFTDPCLPIEYKLLGDASVSETYAFLFEHILSDPGWLRKHISLPDQKRFLAWFFLHKLFFLRRYAAKLRYELKLHSSSLRRMDAEYKHILESVLRFRHPSSHYLVDVDDQFYSAHYLRAWIFDAQLREKLKHEFGQNWFENKKSGEFLVGLWSMGEKYDVDELAELSGFDGLDASALLDEIRTHVSLSLLG